MAPAILSIMVSPLALKVVFDDYPRLAAYFLLGENPQKLVGFHVPVPAPAELRGSGRALLM